MLQKVPVHSMREIWGILEVIISPASSFVHDSLYRQVVRDQCWLNEILLGCQWSIATLEETEPVEGEATEEELEAALSGIHYLIFTVSWGADLTFFRFHGSAQNPCERLSSRKRFRDRCSLWWCLGYNVYSAPATQNHNDITGAPTNVGSCRNMRLMRRN